MSVGLLAPPIVIMLFWACF